MPGEEMELDGLSVLYGDHKDQAEQHEADD